jgi:hypothetical protein
MFWIIEFSRWEKRRGPGSAENDDDAEEENSINGCI